MNTEALSTLNLDQITIKKRSGIYIDNSKTSNDNQQLALTLNANMMSLGFVMSKELFNEVSKLPLNKIEEYHNSLIPILENLKGNDVSYNVMYPNFPQQVLDAPYIELVFNALIHYWTLGEWKPNYDKLPREFAFEKTNFQTIELLNKNDVKDIFTKLLASNSSISESDYDVIKWFFNQNQFDLIYPKEIPFKENLCVVAGWMDYYGRINDLKELIKTPTDLLRVITFLSGGDFSLAENSKFKNFPRSKRKVFVNVLENIINEDDIQRHRNKWIRLFHNLHVGEYKKKAPKTFEIAQKIRENQRLETFNSKVQQAIDNRELSKVIKLLEKRPGDFARKLDELLRKNRNNRNVIVDKFLDCANSISTRVLMQLLGHFNSRKEKVEKRVIFPKGNVQKARVVRNELKPLGKEVVKKLINGISDVLLKRFSEKEDLGNVYIDKALKEAPIPMQQRSSSNALYTVARGTRLPMSDKDTLRFFIYWIGNDIDLSATLHDEDLNEIEHISYTNLRSSNYNACHSGDITEAPDGAAEFIDINTKEAFQYGARYIVMNVLVYRGTTFGQHEKCYAGYMTRDYPDSNEIFDPKTVEQKVDLTNDNKNAIPIIFDLKERKAIWTDLGTSEKTKMGGNNVESNEATIVDMLNSMINLFNKPTLYQLFALHGKARGQIVDNIENANVVYSLKDFDLTKVFDEGYENVKSITAFEIDEINADYME